MTEQTNVKIIEGMNIFHALENLNQKGVAAERLAENHRKLEKINKEIADMTKSLMSFENKYDKACKALEISLETEKTEMENFYKRFIVWERAEVLVNVEATKAKIDEHMRKIGAENNEGMKKFAEEAKKMVQAYHYKQQLVNALEGKVRTDSGKGVREFGGEKEHLDMNNKIIEKIPQKLGEGKYEELRKDMKELLANSKNIAVLYTTWEKVIIKVLTEELRIQEEFDKLGQERAKELAGMRKIARDMIKKVPGAYGKEKEMDNIIRDVIKYTRTFGETRGGKLRNQEDLQRKIQFITEEEIKKSKKKLTENNLEYLKEKLNSFIKTEGARIFEKSTLFGDAGEARKFAETLSITVTRKIEEMKRKLKR